jgi:hypothetical protein
LPSVASTTSLSSSSSWLQLTAEVVAITQTE